MLLMQYNDNIPAVFGFPLVIPHQRRGGMEEERRTKRGGQGGAHCSWQCRAVFVHSSISSLHCSFLLVVLPVRPAVYHRAKERSCTAFTSTLLSGFMD